MLGQKFPKKSMQSSVVVRERTRAEQTKTQCDRTFEAQSFAQNIDQRKPFIDFTCSELKNFIFNANFLCRNGSQKSVKLMFFEIKNIDLKKKLTFLDKGQIFLKSNNLKKIFLFVMTLPINFKKSVTFFQILWPFHNI